MNRIGSFVLVFGGIALMACGYDAYHSVGSGISRLFTGAPTDRSLWLLIGGGLLAISGLSGFSLDIK